MTGCDILRAFSKQFDQKSMNKILSVSILASMLTLSALAQTTNYATSVTSTTINGVTTVTTNQKPVSVTTTIPLSAGVDQIPSAGPASTPAVGTPVSTTFLGSVEDYFTAFSTNTWAGTKGFLQTGAVYQKNINFGNSMELGIDVKDLSTNIALYADASALNALGLGGVIDSQVGLLLGYRIHDVQAIVGLRGGYDFKSEQGEGSLVLGVMKKLTENTFAGVSFEPTLVGDKVFDYLKLNAGFTF